MQNEDREFLCIACGERFVFTKAEQQQWARRGFVHPPKRCRRCREERRGRTPAYGQGSYSQHRGDAGNQNIYRAPAFRDEPKRHTTYRSPMEGARRLPPPEYEITCNKCGAKDYIPFKPLPNRNVYCHACYSKLKKQNGGKGNKKASAVEKVR